MNYTPFSVDSKKRTFENTDRIFSICIFHAIIILVIIMSRKNRKYTFEEKLMAAKMHVEENIGCVTVANKLNCDKKRVLAWSKKYQEGGEEALKFETRGRGNTGRPKKKKFNSVEEELKYVKAERDILKKTLEILKKQQKV